MLHSEPTFWAKTTADGMPGCSVCEHGQAAGEVAKLLLKWLPEEVRSILPDGVVTLVAMHDIGKISPGFQTKCAQWKGPYGNADDETIKEWSGRNGKHAEISRWLLEQLLKERYKKIGRRASYAECLGAHHGRYSQGLGNSSLPYSERTSKEWMSYAKNYFLYMEDAFGMLPQEPFPKDDDALKEWIIGLIEVADWIASNEKWFPPEGGLKDIAVAAQDALRSIGFSNDPPVVSGRLWEDLFPHAPSPRALQSYLWKQPAIPGVYVIEDAMGGGKTEAALGLAYRLMEQGKANGLYFALPTQTTSNRIFLRVCDFLKNAGATVSEKSLRLAHGNSWLEQDVLFNGWNRSQKKSGLKEEEYFSPIRSWFASSRRTLLARYGVGTIDQALMGEINVKHRFVRRYALAGKVVILDEVHSYDVYTGALISNLVRNLRHMGATVVILSATLTQDRLRDLLSDAGGAFEKYPLVSVALPNATVQTETFPPDRRRHIQISCSSLSEEEAVHVAYERAERGQCVLWIRNTVKDAQNAYKLLREESKEGGPEIGLLHARFPLWRRNELEEKWLTALNKSGECRPNGCVLVATQVAEQSLDIDADFLITDLAPTDMLLQRAGRLWRHEDRPLERRHADRAEMMILVPDIQGNTVKEVKKCLGASGYVYAPYVLMRSLSVWLSRSEIALPDDIRPLVDATYVFCNEEEGSYMKDLYDDLEKKKQKMKDSAKHAGISDCSPQNDTDDPSTRYGTIKTVELLLLKETPEHRSETQTRYIPLFGEPFIVDKQYWSFEAARSIQENLVRIPENMLKDWKEKEELTGYGFLPLYPIAPLDTLDANAYPGQIRWSEELGVYKVDPVFQSNNFNHDDEEEFMY